MTESELWIRAVAASLARPGVEKCTHAGIAESADLLVTAYRERIEDGRICDDRCEGMEFVNNGELVDDAASLGERLRKLRTQSSQSLRDVARDVGFSKAHVWELETGRSRNPSLDLLRRLADHFEVTVAYLIGEETRSDGYGVWTREKLIERLREVADRWENISGFHAVTNHRLDSFLDGDHFPWNQNTEEK